MWSLGQIAIASRHLTNPHFQQITVDYNNIYFYCNVDFILQRIPRPRAQRSTKAKQQTLKSGSFFLRFHLWCQDWTLNLYFCWALDRKSEENGRINTNIPWQEKPRSANKGSTVPKGDGWVTSFSRVKDEHWTSTLLLASQRGNSSSAWRSILSNFHSHSSSPWT